MVAILYSSIPTIFAGEHAHEHDHDFEFTEQHAHDHGKVAATLSYSENRLNLRLLLPAFNAFGFEHAPSNSQEQALVDSTLENLSNAINIIELQPGCQAIKTDAYKSDVLASSGTDEHYNLELDYTFSCPINDALSISFTLFKTIPSINQISIQYLSDKEQKLFTLDPENHSVTVH